MSIDSAQNESDEMEALRFLDTRRTLELQREFGTPFFVYDEDIHEGGPFTAIAYCWTQALEYFPPEKRAEMEHWFYREHMPQLVAWDEAFPDNLARKHTSFPTAFGIFFHKPA